jgi:hypothetical protein
LAGGIGAPDESVDTEVAGKRAQAGDIGHAELALQMADHAEEEQFHAPQLGRVHEVACR